MKESTTCGRSDAVGAAAPTFAVAALCECFEECGLWLGAAPECAAQPAPLRARLHAGESLAALAQAAGLPCPRCIRIGAQRRVIGVLMSGQPGYDEASSIHDDCPQVVVCREQHVSDPNAKPPCAPGHPRVRVRRRPLR